LDAVVLRIRDEDVPARIGRYPERRGELAVGPVAPPGGEEGAARVELLRAAVEPICDVDVPAPVGRHARGVLELAVAKTVAPPRVQKSAARIELLDAVVV